MGLLKTKRKYKIRQKEILDILTMAKPNSMCAHEIARLYHQEGTFPEKLLMDIGQVVWELKRTRKILYSTSESCKEFGRKHFRYKINGYMTRKKKVKKELVSVFFITDKFSMCGKTSASYEQLEDIYRSNLSDKTKQCIFNQLIKK